jgi:hypothetical protein
MILTDGERDQLRADVEATLPDTCRIERSSGNGAFDENTGTYGSTTPTEIYEGACRMGSPGLVPSEVVAGEQQVTQQSYVLTLPASVTTIEVDDTVTMLTSADADLVNRVFRIVGLKHSSIGVQRRVLCEETT